MNVENAYEYGRDKNFFKRLSTIEKETTKDFVQDSNVFNEIAQNHPERKSTITYINKVSGLNAYRLDEAQYFSVGEEKWKALLCELEKAEKYIFLEYFIIERGVMWNTILDILTEKAKQGVDVRVIYDDVGSMLTLPHSYPSKLRALGIKCAVFRRFIPVLSSSFNNRDHRKICVVDGKVAFTGGVNLADEYINVKIYVFFKFFSAASCVFPQFFIECT